VVEVDAVLSESSGHLFIRDSAVVDGVVGAVVCVCRSRHGELRVWNNVIILILRLTRTTSILVNNLGKGEVTSFSLRVGQGHRQKQNNLVQYYYA